MLSVERQERIKNIFLEKKSLTVADLAAQFGVSFETIRRDLRVLETNGIIEKTYGGATLKQRVSSTADFQTLSGIMVDAKANMAKTAASFIAPDDCIYIDFSTTCAHIAPLLGNISLTVLTSSLAVMNELSVNQQVSLFSSGGSWDIKNFAFLGRTAVDNISKFHLDKAFISCRALGMETGISDKTEDEADLRRQVIESSNEVYLLADHTKFDKMTFVKTCGFERITAIITDMPLSTQWKLFLDKRNIAHYDCEYSPECEEELGPEE